MTDLQQQKFAKDFWPYFNRVAATIIVCSQLIVVIITGIVLYGFGFFRTDPILFGAILLVQIILGVIGSVIIFQYISRPIRDLLAAIVHISGEPTVIPPPNPNDPRFRNNGFKDVLQTIYGLAGSSVTTPGIPQKNRGLANNFLENALDETSCGFVVMNHKREVTYANKAAPTNINRDGIMSLGLLFNGSDTLEAWLEQCDKDAVHAEHSWLRVPNKLPEEEGRRFFDVIASYDKGVASEVVLTLVDRTNTYSAGEQELDFIAFAAHELRGPITVIRGYLDVLNEELTDVLKDDQQELFRRLTVSANRLSGYVNNILNTSRFDRRHLKMHIAETTVSDVYATIRDDMHLRASAQNRLLAITIPTDLPTIAGDPASLGEVFGNLIDNAIKYSHEGGAITVSAELKGDFVEVSIEDHGIGMPSSVVGNLFQKFYRSHRSRETVAGTGIGLYISKAIVESHGGTISVRSEDGKGSTFIVALPTYRSVADTLVQSGENNENLIDSGNGWIKNHSMYRG